MRFIKHLSQSTEEESQKIISFERKGEAEDILGDFPQSNCSRDFLVLDTKQKNRIEVLSGFFKSTS